MLSWSGLCTQKPERVSAVFSRTKVMNRKHSRDFTLPRSLDSQVFTAIGSVLIDLSLHFCTHCFLTHIHKTHTLQVLSDMQGIFRGKTGESSCLYVRMCAFVRLHLLSLGVPVWQSDNVIKMSELVSVLWNWIWYLIGYDGSHCICVNPAVTKTPCHKFLPHPCQAHSVTVTVLITDWLHSSFLQMAKSISQKNDQTEDGSKRVRYKTDVNVVSPESRSVNISSAHCSFHSEEEKEVYQLIVLETKMQQGL